MSETARKTNGSPIASIRRSCPGPCQLCGQSSLTDWEVHPDCILWYCAKCDLYQYGPEPGSQAYREDYHLGYEKNRERKIYSALTRLSYIRGLLAGSEKTIRALDVGCSIGASVEAAKRLHWNSVGVDVSQDAVDYCNRIGLKCYWYQGTRLPFPDNTFDVLTAWHVIEHVLDVQQTLSDWQRVLRPGGLIVVATPDGSSPKVKRLGKAYKKFWAPEHTYTFNPDNLAQFATRIGLEPSDFPRKPRLTGLPIQLTGYEWIRRCNEHLHRWRGTHKEFYLVLRKPQAGSTTVTQRPVSHRRAA